MIIPDGYRGCKKCGKLKPLEEMAKCASCKHGRAPRCKECEGIGDKQYRRKLPTITKKERHLKRHYGLSLAEYESMLEEQNNCCLICDAEFTETAHVDHCHTTGQVRGLLCPFCNRGLGHFRDDTELMQKAIAYLENSRAVS